VHFRRSFGLINRLISKTLIEKTCCESEIRRKEQKVIDITGGCHGTLTHVSTTFWSLRTASGPSAHATVVDFLLVK
jgi:hypothetical protein